MCILYWSKKNPDSARFGGVAERKKRIMTVTLKKKSFVHFIAFSIPILTSLNRIQSLWVDSAKIPLYSLDL